ncbi:MAG TPA: winged helix-turn-helix transcriptional regulator [Pyrinomonadaceae bacterium]|nr:winged helix-turn-helix transcriptional regulator [Pyrinomonadaceae bacterium]
MNDSLYNPDTMSKEEIKALFVARQPLLDELISTIRNQPTGAGVQHLLIIAPRGMGKTTMLLMLQFAVEDNKDLSKNWQAVRFPEESYDITELADFWLKVLDYLDDESLKPKIEEIERRFTNSEDLREAAWATVKDWSKKNKKRILLLIDNFDMILDQIGNDVEQARLRDILMNDGTVMFIGCAPSYFHQIQDYEQPLYNFFKISNLNDLKFPDIEELLRRRAEIDEIPNIEELLQKNRTRIKALETFTGGNPRLVLMLYRIITSSDMTEVRNGLDRLLDAVTPFYKDKTEKLPPQQRKIINEIAQYGLEKNEGISPTEIAQRIRMTPNQVSSQLKRLSENGYVRALNIRGRSSFYVISEPLYAIWAQMRFGRNAREKRNWLVQILKALFDVQEIQKEIQKLDGRVKSLKLVGRENKARGVLEYIVCLLETNPSLMQSNYQLAIESYLELKEISSLRTEIELSMTTKTEIGIEQLTSLTIAVLEKIHQEGVINEETFIATKSIKFMNEAQTIFNKSMDAQTTGQFAEALKGYEEVISLLKEIIEIRSKDKALKNFFLFFVTYMQKGKILLDLNKYKDANNSFNKAIKNFRKDTEKQDNIVSLELLAHTHSKNGFTLMALKRMDEALLEYDKAVSIFDNLTKEKKIRLVFLEDILMSYSTKMAFLIISNKIDEAKETLLNLVILLKPLKVDNIMEILSKVLAVVVGLGFVQNTRELINKTKLEKEFSHLLLAIDYLETKDETLIEKLSPEIRIVVEETIKTLQMTNEEKSDEPNQNNKKDRASKKSKSLALSK